MEMESQKAPGALKKPKPTGPEILEAGTYLIKYRNTFKLTQRQAAKLLGLSYRRIQIYEATTGWNQENRGRILAYPGLFDFSATSGLARQGWSNQRSLSKAIDRIIAGEAPRKRPRRKGADAARIDPGLANVQDRLRQVYGTKVVIDGGAIAFYHYGNKEVFEMLVERLLGGI